MVLLKSVGDLLTFILEFKTLSIMFPVENAYRLLVLFLVL